MGGPLDARAAGGLDGLRVGRRAGIDHGGAHVGAGRTSPQPATGEADVRLARRRRDWRLDWRRPDRPAARPASRRRVAAAGVGAADRGLSRDRGGAVAGTRRASQGDAPGVPGRQPARQRLSRVAVAAPAVAVGARVRLGGRHHDCRPAVQGDREPVDERHGSSRRRVWLVQLLRGAGRPGHAAARHAARDWTIRTRSRAGDRTCRARGRIRRRALCRARSPRRCS